jgi:hypothetical protein
MNITMEQAEQLVRATAAQSVTGLLGRPRSQRMVAEDSVLAVVKAGSEFKVAGSYPKVLEVLNPKFGWTSFYVVSEV